MADKKPKKQPKRMTRRAFVASGVGAAGLVGVTAAANVGTNMFKSALDHYVGAGETTIESAPGSEDWDTAYYDQLYRGRGAAAEDAKELVVEIEGEGIVLLKNDGALPLAAGTEVSLLGRYAADPVYGGAGSGTVDPNDCVTLHDGIAAAGLSVNDVAYGWIAENYEGYPKADITMDNPDTATYYIGEIPWDAYPEDARASVAGTTALVVIGRGGGEGGDLSTDLLGTLNDGKHANFTANDETAGYVEGQHELELTVEERDLVAAAKEACDKVVVLYNGSTPLEMAPLMSGELEVDAILSIGSLGASGATAVGQVLTGAVNPSGRTTDIWPADLTADPTFGNFGGRRYTDVADYYPTNYNTSVAEGTAYFVEYKEGIYLGYRYYETAAAEAGAGNYAGFDYDDAVVFPFGYGLSYTTFEQTLDSCAIEGEDVAASVTVTNVGDVAGKCVVELYYSAPYTPGGIEKSAVVLGAFGKTQLLEPGASETVELSFPVRAMASWSSGAGGYVLDAGDYVISLRSDSHTVIAEQVVVLEGQTYATDSATGNALAVRFADLDEYMEANCENLSREDFAGTWPPAASDKTASECGIALETYDWSQHLGDEAMPTTGADNGVSLIDLRGRAFDDELWDQLLDELTVDDMTTMLSDCAYNTPAIAHIGKPATSEPDGPAGFTSLTGATGNCAYCSEFVMAQTWNTELMYRLGQMVGQEALASGYNGWYAPAMNMHRSPFGGRNFEYYSEDPLLAGKMGAAVVSGCASNGCYAMIKHYALNDQESYRIQHLCTWATEQAVREIYLRPFEITVKEATCEMRYISDDKGTVETVSMPGCTAMMSSFNYVGTQWAGGSHALCTEVPRDEWGFTGCIITDFNLYGHMDKNWALDGGTDMHLTYAAMTPAFQGTGEASVVARLREASHRVLYTVVNSNAMQGMAPGSTITTSPAPWQYGVWAGSAVLLAGAAALGARCYLGARRNRAIDAAERDAEQGGSAT